MVLLAVLRGDVRVHVLVLARLAFRSEGGRGSESVEVRGIMQKYRVGVVITEKE